MENKSTETKSTELKVTQESKGLGDRLLPNSTGEVGTFIKNELNDKATVDTATVSSETLTVKDK